MSSAHKDLLGEVPQFGPETSGTLGKINRNSPTYETAIARIRLIYDSLGFEIGLQTLGAVLSSELNQKIEHEHFGALYAFVDEEIVLMRYLSFHFISALARGEKRSITFVRLSIKIISTATSIRLLCGFGFDSNARMQLRLLYELVILWCRFLFDDCSRQEFEASQEPSDANRFWHKYIARQRTEKYLRSKIQDENLVWLGDLNSGEFLADARTRMGLSSHPSLISLMMDTSHDFNDEFSDRMAIRNTSPSSHFTLVTTAFVMALPFGFLRQGKIEGGFPRVSEGFVAVDLLSRGPFQPRNSKAKNCDEYFARIRDALYMIGVITPIFAKGLRGSKDDERSTDIRSADPEVPNGSKI